jgi:hypothetical protein
MILNLFFLLTLCTNPALDYQLVDAKPKFVFGNEYFLDGILDVCLVEEHTFVLTKNPPFLNSFLKEHVGSWINKGQGPADLTNPLKVSTRENEICVLNLRPNKINIYDLKGKLKETIPIQGYTFVHNFETTEYGFLIEVSQFGSADRQIVLIKQGDLETQGTQETIISIPAPTVIRLSDPKGPVKNFKVQAPFQKKACWTFLKGEKVVYWGIEELINVDSKLDFSRIENCPDLKLPVTEQAKIDWVDQNFPKHKTLFGIQNAYQGLRKIAETTIEFPKFYPEILKLESAQEEVWALRGNFKDSQLWEKLGDNESLRVKLPQQRSLEAIGTFFFACSFDHSESGEVIELYPKITGTGNRRN